MRFTDPVRLLESSTGPDDGLASRPGPGGGTLGPSIVPPGTARHPYETSRPTSLAAPGTAAWRTPWRHSGRTVSADLQIVANRRRVTGLETMARVAASVRTAGSWSDITARQGRGGISGRALITRRSGVRIPPPLPIPCTRTLSTSPPHQGARLLSPGLNGAMPRNRAGA